MQRRMPRICSGRGQDAFRDGDCNRLRNHRVRLQGAQAESGGKRGGSLDCDGEDYIRGDFSLCHIERVIFALWVFFSGERCLEEWLVVFKFKL